MLITHKRVAILLGVCILTAVTSELPGQDNPRTVRLIDQTPFDQITLKEGPEDKRVFKIFPLGGGLRRPQRFR